MGWRGLAAGGGTRNKKLSVRKICVVVKNVVRTSNSGSCGNMDPSILPMRSPRRVLKLLRTTSGMWSVFLPCPEISSPETTLETLKQAVGPCGRPETIIVLHFFKRSCSTIRCVNFLFAANLQMSLSVNDLRG